MTEADWNSSTDPQPMLDSLRSSASDRKLRLFASACYWHVPQVLTERNDNRVLDVVERFADGVVARGKFRDWGWLRVGNARFLGSFGAMEAAQASADYTATMAARIKAAADDEKAMAREAAMAQHATPPQANPVLASEPCSFLGRNTERAYQAALLRCIFGDRFRPISLKPSWLTPAVVELANDIYENRAFNRLPILALALALEESGCADAEILNHCRGEGPHVRGCWVVDCLLGK